MLRLISDFIDTNGTVPVACNSSAVDFLGSVDFLCSVTSTSFVVSASRNKPLYLHNVVLQKTQMCDVNSRAVASSGIMI